MNALRAFLVDMATVAHTVAIIVEESKADLGPEVEIKMVLAVEEDVPDYLIDRCYTVFEPMGGDLQFQRVTMSVAEVFDANPAIEVVDEISSLDFLQSVVNTLQQSGLTGKFA
ncbi:hypothetical protein F7U66_01960 [Vibrio parahaemolyticus]|nr:hypothetical protein [Vibrio parahaemolyticus]